MNLKIENSEQLDLVMSTVMHSLIRYAKENKVKSISEFKESEMSLLNFLKVNGTGTKGIYCYTKVIEFIQCSD